MEHIIRIVIADEHAFTRKSLRSLVELEPCLTVVAEAKDASEAITTVNKHLPEVVLMDISRSVLNGIEATRIITAKYPDTKVIVLTMHIDQNYSACAYAVGACCVLVKGCEKDEVIKAIMNCYLQG